MMLWIGWDVARLGGQSPRTSTERRKDGRMWADKRRAPKGELPSFHSPLDPLRRAPEPAI